MLYLYQSNRLEYLAALLAKLLTLPNTSSPWETEEIVVQSQGMRRYINRFLAQKNGIAANLRFSLPAGFSWRLTRTLLPDTPKLNPFHTEVMRWRLLNLFQSETFRQPEFTAVRQALHHYLSSSEAAPYHLAGQLADIFDQYLVYRSNWITAWNKHQLLNLGESENWQAVLWRYLEEQAPQQHRAAQVHAVLSKLSAEYLPARLMVFGLSALAPMYLNLLQAIAVHTDVHIFALNPSNEYWGNILPASILLDLDEWHEAFSGHPLLSSLGKQGRDFFDALTEMPDIQYAQEIYDPLPLHTSQLTQLQHDIQCLRLPENTIPQKSDTSVQFVAAHSRLRELQILKDQLLQDLADHPDWQPHDIAVLTPHIEAYIPFIDAVFGQSQGGNQILPYSIADAKISRKQPLLQLLEKLIALTESRLEIDQVLALLDEPALRRRSHFSNADIELISAAFIEQGIHWGDGETMRRAFGGKGDDFTWQHGMNRTALGWLLPNTANWQHWQNIYPWTADINLTAVLVRAQDWLAALLRHYRLWQTDADITAWQQRVRNFIRDFADDDSLSGNAMQQLETALAEWQAQAELANFQAALSPALVREHLQGFLNSSSEAGFLRGGITFCGMVPMRSLPFKCLCLLGLNDGEFPRTTKSAPFDLIAQHPKKGDRARRDDDRYLFLEAILSAREKLYLSYIGKDIRKNEDLAPSALIYELTDTLAAMSGQTPQAYIEQHIRQYPLQAFSHAYFNGEFSSSRADYASALNQTPQPEKPFTDGFHTETPTDALPINTDDFLTFWRNPVKHWLRQQLQWQAPYQHEDKDADEPFKPTDSGRIYRDYLHARRKHADFNTVTAALSADGVLPVGALGQLNAEPLRNAVLSLDETLLQSPALPDTNIHIATEHGILSGSLNQLHQHGQFIEFPKRITDTDQIILRLKHLIFCAALPNCEPYTYVFSPEDTLCFLPLPKEQAHQQLTQWLRYYRQGQQQALPFFPRTSWRAAQKWHGSESTTPPLTAENEAQLNYNGNDRQKPQSSYAEVAQIFVNDPIPPIKTTLFWDLIHDLLLPLAAIGEKTPITKE